MGQLTFDENNRKSTQRKAGDEESDFPSPTGFFGHDSRFEILVNEIWFKVWV